MNVLQTGPFPNSSLLPLTRRQRAARKRDPGSEASGERKRRNEWSDRWKLAVLLSGTAERQRHTPPRAETAGNSCGGGWKSRASSAAGPVLLRDGDPRHGAVCTGPRGRFSASTSADPAALAQTWHTELRKGPCRLATSTVLPGPGRCASPQGWLRAPGPAQTSLWAPQAWPRAPPPASGLAPGTTTCLRAGPRRHHQRQGWPQAPSTSTRADLRPPGAAPPPGALGCPSARAPARPRRDSAHVPPQLPATPARGRRRARAPIGSHGHHSRGGGSPIGWRWEGREG